jgi:uncharacterized membrane protein (GlpM family)
VKSENLTFRVLVCSAPNKVIPFCQRLFCPLFAAARHLHISVDTTLDDIAVSILVTVNHILSFYIFIRGLLLQDLTS